jgi:hypothetical protein
VTDEFELGKVQGVTDATLSQHAAHLTKINGSMDRVADRLDGIATGLQRLVDSVAADRVTVIATAAALKDAEQARRDKVDTSWSPKAKFISVILAIAVVVATVVGVLTFVAH